MIAACGAENRIAQKYTFFVNEMKRHGNKMTPLIGLQFALTVCFSNTYNIFLGKNANFYDSFLLFLVALVLHSGLVQNSTLKVIWTTLEQ
jgi:hypothetical protein